MKTILTTSVRLASEYIRKGEVVAFPTETVYGLGANAFDEKAIKKVFKAKGRPADNPLIVHITNFNELQFIAKTIPKSAEKFINAFFPGPLTVILPKTERISSLITAGLNTVGVRMPNHPITQKFLSHCKVPVVAPSANRSGKPSPTTWQAVKADLDSRISCILKSKQTKVGLESTVVDCTGKVPLVLRAGAITLEQLRQVIPATTIYIVTKISKVKSPGMKYRHYAPNAKVVLINDKDNIVPKSNSAFIGINPSKIFEKCLLIKNCKDIKDYSHSLFHFFRECDSKGIMTIYCKSVKEKGLGLALMDRLQKASNI